MARPTLPKAKRRDGKSYSLSAEAVTRVQKIKERTRYPASQVVDLYLLRALDTWRFEEVLRWRK